MPDEKEGSKAANANGSSETPTQEADRLKMEASQALALKMSQLGFGDRFSRHKQDTDEPQEHKFWSTQPVPKVSEDILEPAVNEAIEPNKPTSEVQQAPYTLPEGFEWVEIDVEQEDQMKELYNLLSENYVEDSDAMFRFDYSASFLKWLIFICSMAFGSHFDCFELGHCRYRGIKNPG